MEQSYGKKNEKTFSREAIIGLGEASFRKNYYPELQEKIMDLERINSRSEALISAMPDILLVSDSDGVITPFSQNEHKDSLMLSRILGNPAILQLLTEGLTEVFLDDRLLTKEFQLSADGNTYYLEARFRKSETNEVLIIIRDMTERILLEKQLRELVEQDTLTKLYNRHNFEKQLKKYAHQEISNLVIVSIDVNGLKFINDTLGHLIGDETIIHAADIISQIFSEYGLVARIGGDEFGIILEDTDEKKIEKLLNQLNKKSEAHNKIAGNTALSLAYGYSYHKDGPVNVEFMFQEADNNMYQNKLLKKESFRNTFVKTFMKALEAKDYISEGHADRMENLATSIGKALSLRQDQMDRIILLTKFHDIGKIGIPDSILKKPNKLTEDEWKVMRTHSSIGERIAQEAVEIKDIAHLILKHHEKWDGSGYPLGLSGEAIPLECRILAIVDTFDAMTNDRPYRKALPNESAIQEIQRCSGTQFDPSLVSIFCRII